MDTTLFPDLEAGGNAGTTSSRALVTVTPEPIPDPLAGIADSVEKPKPDEFDWYDDPNIVQHEVPSVAVYENTVGNIVIRQRQEWDEDDDTFVYIAPANARKVADALLRIAGIAEPSSRPRQPNGSRR